MAVADWDVYYKGEVQDKGGVGQIRLKLRVLMTSADDTLADLRRGLPEFQRWQPHPSAPGFVVDEFQGTQQANPLWWDCTVTYTDESPKDPLEIPVTIGEIKSFKLDGATILEWDGTPILNTAGEPVEPFSKPEQIVVYPIIKNIAGLGDWLLDFESCINSDTFRIGTKICDPKTLLINSVVISAENTQGDTTYRTATIELWRRKSKWLEYFPSRGFNEVGDIPNPRDPFKNKTTGDADSKVKGLKLIKINGEAPDKPQFLDRDGKWIKTPTPDQIVMLTKQLYPAIPFSSFPSLK